MSNLIADIERYYYVRDEAPNTPRNIAEGLERDYVLIPKADLPEVKPSPDDKNLVEVDGLTFTVEVTDGFPLHRTLANQHLALAAYQESLDTAEARLQERRDKQTRELSRSFAKQSYAELYSREREIVDELLAFEDEQAQA